MPKIKNQIKESIQFVLDRTFENNEPCYFSLAKDINEIIFQYFKLHEEEKFKIENRNLECRLNNECGDISPFDPDFKLEELNNDSIESDIDLTEHLKNFEDYKLIQFGFDSEFRYYAFLSVFRELLKDENLKINQEYYLLNITDMYPELKEKVFTMKEYAGYPQSDLDIKDPWGYNLDTFLSCASEIEGCVEKIIDKIQKNNKED